MEMGALIIMRDICKSYYMGKNELQVLKNVSLEIQKGDFAAVLGPSGSGKSTLMNIMGCIDIADSGEYILNGQNIKDFTEDQLADIRNKEIGFIFQKFNLLPKYTAQHNVAFPLLLRGMEKNEAYAKAAAVLEAVGLADRMQHKPLELSGGQQQRVSVARALVGEPKILLADEPTGNLDSKSGDDIMKLFHQLNSEGHTMILITHDMDVANQAKHIIHVRDGCVSQ